VIRIDADAIARLINTGYTPLADGELTGTLWSSATDSVQLALHDDSLPSLTVSGYSVDESGMLTVNCTPSEPLGAGQVVYAYMTNTGGDLFDFNLIGWSSLTGGQLKYSDIDNSTYTVQLAVVQPGGQYHTSAAGPPVALDGDVYAANVYGIEDGGSYLTGQTLSFTAVGYTPLSLDLLGYVPESWSAGSQSGSWSAAPYTGSLVFSTPGTYTLSVVFREQSHNGTEWVNTSNTITRSVTFTVSQALSLTASPADGQIYTGGRITLTPNIPGGTWSFDTSLLERDGNTFTGLAAGTARVTYTVGAQSAYFDVVISKSQLPPTGQDFTWLYIAAGGAALALAAALTLRRRTAKG